MTLKTCVLIIGRLDTFENCFDSLKKYILDLLDVDIFFSGYQNHMGLEYCENKIKELWNPKKYILRNYDSSVRKEVHPNDEKFTRKRPETFPHTWLSSMYNMKLVNKLKNEYEKENNFKYDLCIKSRTECLWHSNITEDDIKLVKEDEKNILIPTAWDFKDIHPLGCSDISCVTSSKGMDMYASCIDYVDSYYDSGEFFHPESLLGIHLDRIGMNRIPITKGFDPFTKQPNQSGWCVVDPNRVRTEYKA